VPPAEAGSYLLGRDHPALTRWAQTNAALRARSATRELREESDFDAASAEVLLVSLRMATQKKVVLFSQPG